MASIILLIEFHPVLHLWHVLSLILQVVCKNHIIQIRPKFQSIGDFHNKNITVYATQVDQSIHLSFLDWSSGRALYTFVVSMLFLELNWRRRHSAH